MFERWSCGAFQGLLWERLDTSPREGTLNYGTVVINFQKCHHFHNFHRRWIKCTGVNKTLSSHYTAAADLFLILQMLHWQFDKINSSPKQLLGEECPPRSLLIFSHCKPDDCPLRGYWWLSCHIPLHINLLVHSAAVLSCSFWFWSRSLAMAPTCTGYIFDQTLLLCSQMLKGQANQGVPRVWFREQDTNTQQHLKLF